MTENKQIEQLIEKIIENSHTIKNSLKTLLLNITNGIVFTDKKGTILYSNKTAKCLIGDNTKNIADSGYLFSFESYVLDTSTDIMNYSPFTEIINSKSNVTIDTVYEGAPDTKKQITLNSYIINNDNYLIIFNDKTIENNNQTYEDLTATNIKLKEKIKENEQLRNQAQSQAIRESLANRISNAIRNSLEIDTILQTSVEELGKTLSTDRTILIKIIPGENKLPITQEYALPSQTKLKDHTINIDEDFFLQEVIETHETATGQHIDTWDKVNKNKYKLIVPVIRHEELFGMLVLLRQNRQWHPEEINLVQSIADQISISIKNAQLFEETNSKNIKISVLNEILKSINSSLILDDVFYTIGKEIKRLITFDRASIAILDNQTRQVRLFARIKNSGEIDILQSGPLIAKGTAISWAIENLKPICLNIDDNDQFSDITTLKYSGIKTAIIIPMVNKGVVSGIFYVGSKNEKVYNDSEVEIMTQIAGQIAVAVENAKLYWQTQTQALKETLINQIINSIRKSLKLSDVLQTTVDELGNALGVTNCLFRYRLNIDNDKHIYESTSSKNKSISEAFEEFYQITYKTTYEKERDYLIWEKSNPKINEDVKSFLLKTGLKSLLIYPIYTTDHITNEEIKIGIITIGQAATERDWQIDDIKLLKVLQNQITLTIDQARLFEQTQKQKTELEKTLQKLKEAQAQLVQSEKMASLGQLVAGVAHEINTPIGSITSNNSIFMKCTEKIKQFISEEEPNINKVNQILQILEETNKINTLACERINDIVKSLKNFARLDESELKSVNIHEGINSTLKLIKHELKERITIETNFSELPIIECYPNLLNQVFMNIIINAYQSIEGKGKITIETSNDKNDAFIKISDTGAGISEENLKRLFDPGFTTKGVGVGTGLGLSICYQIIEKHKGQIKVKSKLGEGSTFTIAIPIKQKG